MRRPFRKPDYTRTPETWAAELDAMQQQYANTRRSKMVRCKLLCNSVKVEHGQCEVALNPVYDSNPASPNFRWSTATPSGEVRLTITNPAAFNQFAEGQHYFADFEPCAADAIDK